MEREYYKKLGRTIHGIRRAKNISQEYMASKLGMSQNMYSKIELGKSKCSAYHFLCIMGLLRVKLEMEELGILYTIEPLEDSDGLG